MGVIIALWPSQHRGVVHVTGPGPTVGIEIVIKCMQTICQFLLTSHIDLEFWK